MWNPSIVFWLDISTTVTCVDWCPENRLDFYFDSKGDSPERRNQDLELVRRIFHAFNQILLFPAILGPTSYDEKNDIITDLIRNIVWISYLGDLLTFAPITQFEWQNPSQDLRLD